ncbi:MAG: acyl-CoA synthetase [Aeromicrobium sp.]|nr:acyl-CoA synthetase [Aeromicrobium sp.]
MVGNTVLGNAMHSLGVMRRAGLIDLAHPVRTAFSSHAMRGLGPIAGAAHMSARRRGDDVALIDELGSLTYRELDERTNAIVRGWAAHGVTAGDVVGVLCRDHRGVVDAMVASGKAGTRLVLLNTGFAKPQLADVAEREGIRALVLDEEFLGLLSAVDPLIPRFLAWHDNPSPEFPTLDSFVEKYESTDLPAPPSQGGLVLLTGGTTGTPKGAPRQVSSPLAAAQFLERIPQRRGDIVHIAAPTFHGTGLSQLIMALALGSTVVVQRRFDALTTLKALADNRATVAVMVPTMLQRILALGPDVLAAHDTSSLRILLCAGAALPADLGNRATEAFGPVIHNFYGCTEVAVASVALPEDWLAAPGTVGRAPRGVTLKLFDAEDKVVTTPHVSGRIFVNNGLTFEGYSGGGTKPMIGKLMSTGDTGHWDDGGRLFIDGRDDDMIVSGGENVFPAEIENLVEGMPEVADVATLPVDDADFGTRLTMFVVLEPGASLDADDITAHIRSNLARFKVPREIVFLDAIPYTATGKVARRELAHHLTA